MFFKITEISYDGIHWFKAETEGGCIVEADGIVVTNPMKDATDEEGFRFQCVKKITPYP